MCKNLKRANHMMRSNVGSKESVISGVECFHLVINIFIFCYVIIWNYVTSIQLREQFLNSQSHAAKDTLHKGIQKHFEMQQETFPIINNVIEWVLVFNILITVTRLTFF